MESVMAQQVTSADAAIAKLSPLPRPIPIPIPVHPIATGPTSIQLPPATLGGAVGCDYVNGRNELLFVEYSGNLSRMSLYPAPSYAVLGSGYNQPEDVKASADGLHAYVTERSGDLVKVALSAANRAGATVVASGMSAPQQLFLDEANNAAYTVEYAPSGRLWRIDLTNGTKTAVLSGLENAVGVVLSADRQFAYVSEQMSGAATGRISAFRLSNGQRHDVVTGLTAPFFLSWMDASQTTLLCPERDPANRLRSVNVIGKTSVIVAQGLPDRPSSATMANAGTALVCCNDVIDEIFLQPAGNQTGGPLLESIGWVPCDWIAGGLADTTSNDASYFYQVEAAPFGGTLPVMVNFAAAAALDAAYYQVTVGGGVRTDVFHGARWNGTAYVGATYSPQTVGGNPGFYAVPSAAEVELWTELPGCYLDSTNLPTGLNTITLELFDAAGGAIAVTQPPPTSVQIYVDNRPCTGTLGAVTLNGTPATPCGFLNYAPATQSTTEVDIPLLASQPGSHATFSLSLIRGVTNITAAIPTGTAGSVTNVGETLAPTVQTLLTFVGNTPPCTTAAFAAYLYVAASAQTGWGRCGQYDASAAEAFMLAPSGA
jgi:hypothetical protein